MQLEAEEEKKNKNSKKESDKKEKKILGIEPTSKYFHQNPSCHLKTQDGTACNLCLHVKGTMLQRN